MREILFRGKRKDSGEWVEGRLLAADVIVPCQQNFILEANCLYEDDGPIIGYEVDEETVGQFTGLTDKNGKKIFEGDIVKFHIETYTSTSDAIGVVIYYNASYGIVYKNNRHFLEFNNMSMYIRWCEVIDNIHDNPELLEGEK